MGVIIRDLPRVTPVRNVTAWTMSVHKIDDLGDCEQWVRNSTWLLMVAGVVVSPH